MKNNKLKALLVSSVIFTGAMFDNSVKALAEDMTTNNDVPKDTGIIEQQLNEKSTPVINGIKINKKLIDINYSKGVTISPKYIVIHDTDNRAAGADAMANRNYFANHPNANSSAHYIIDDSNIVQALEDTWKGWHVGDGGNGAAIQNGNSIGIELAVNKGNNFDKTYQTGIELTRYLMRKYNIPAQNVVMHNHASGKICSRMMIQDRPNLWEEFKSKAAVGMPGESLINDGLNPTARGKLVNVSSYLNVRTQSNATSSVLGNVYPNKIMNIYGEENGYYKVDFMGTRKTYGYVKKDYINIINGSIDGGTNGGTESDKVQINKDGIVVNVEAGSALNVRSGAGTTHSVQDKITKDTKVKVNYETKSWYNISYGSGKTGFVSKDYIKLIEGTNTGGGESGNQSTTPVNKDGVVANLGSVSVLNVRTGAGTTHSIQDKLPLNTKIRVNYKTQNGWYNISYSGKTGFVSSDYIKLVEGGNTGGGTTTPETGNINKNGTVINVTTSLNVRTGPSTSYSIKDKISSGKVVKVNYEKDGWYNISYDGKIGYVSKSYIKLSGSSSGGSTGGGTTTPENNKKTGTVYNVSNVLNVRSGAGTSYSKIGTLKANAKVTINSEKNGWYNIDFNGSTGFVSKDYIKVDGSTTVKPETTDKKGKVINVSTNLNVRSGRGTNHSIIGYVLADEIVTVLDHKEGWHKIEYTTSNGKKTGYVKDDFIKNL
ncbi:MAG: SH3 domain-containing protein [Sarcina sp.]